MPRNFSGYIEIGESTSYVPLVTLFFLVLDSLEESLPEDGGEPDLFDLFRCSFRVVLEADIVIGPDVRIEKSEAEAGVTIAGLACASHIN